MDLTGTENDGVPVAALPAIGEPGRAALEMPDGPPPAVIGPSDIAVSAATLPGIRITAASVRGVQHRAEHTVRQDAFALAQTGGTHAVAVVCDGVGSLDRSDYAAALVSQQLAWYGAAGTPWPEAFAAVNNGSWPRPWPSARRQGCGAMATTAVAVSVSWPDGWWLGEVAWVGDSPLWHLDDDGSWRSITSAARLDGDGHSTPAACGRCRRRTALAPGARSGVRGGALFAMSDGVGQPAGLERRGAGRTLAQLVGTAAGPAHVRGAGRLRQEVPHRRPHRGWDLVR